MMERREKVTGVKELQMNFPIFKHIFEEVKYLQENNQS
jgi:hypothetical protein